LSLQARPCLNDAGTAQVTGSLLFGAEYFQSRLQLQL
jgi:hypothetical protein